MLVAHEDSIAQLQDTLARLIDGAGIVGGHDHGGATAVDAQQQVHDLVGGGGIEVARGFVGKQQLRPIDHGARNSHALLLATGKLVGIRIAAIL